MRLVLCAGLSLLRRSSRGQREPAQDIAVVGALLACSYSDADRWDVLRDCLVSLCRLKAPLHTLLSELTSSISSCNESHISPSSVGLTPFHARYWLSELQSPISAITMPRTADKLWLENIAAAASPLPNLSSAVIESLLSLPKAASAKPKSGKDGKTAVTPTCKAGDQPEPPVR